MNTLTLRRMLFASILAAAAIAGPVDADAVHREVDIDAYVAEQRPLTASSRTLLPPRYISFAAKLAQPPRKAKTDYLRQAFSVLGITEPPAVGHQMLLVTPAGSKLPVYVEDALVPAIAATPAARQGARFWGYHIYTYSRGPAIVVTRLQEGAK